MLLKDDDCCCCCGGGGGGGRECDGYKLLKDKSLELRDVVSIRLLELLL